MVTDEGLWAVAGLTFLTELDLYGCDSVTDVGLQHLRNLKQLQFLDLTYCGTSHAAEEELCRKIPGLSIEHDRFSDDDDDGH